MIPHVPINVVAGCYFSEKRFLIIQNMLAIPHKLALYILLLEAPVVTLYLLLVK